MRCVSHRAFSLPMSCVEEGVGAVEVEAEVVTATILMATMGLPLTTLPITVHRRPSTAMDVVDHPTITHTDTPRILLGHHSSSSTAVGTVRAVPGHSPCLLHTAAGTLTQIAAGLHLGQLRGMVGADITPGPQVEAHMVVAAMVAAADMAAAPTVGVMDMDMAEAEAASIILHHTRADTILAAVMMVAIALDVVGRHEAVVEGGVSEAAT